MRSRAFVTSVAAGLMLALGSPHAQAALVTSTADSGPGTLRQAIADAAFGETIQFSLPPGAVISVESELLIDKSVNIAGPGAGQLQVTGQHRDHVFRISAATVAISGLLISHGNALGGGGIVNSGALRLTDCLLNNNRTWARGGAGILNFGPLTATRCGFSGNSARVGASFGVGGAILNFGSAVLTDCALSGNSADTKGGAIYNEPGASLTLSGCTLSGNSAETGGALYNQGTAVLFRSTLSGNSAAGDGGGINIAVGSATLTECTLSGNSAYHGGGIKNWATATLTRCLFFANYAVNQGGGIHNEAGEMSLQSSTVAGNSAADPEGGGLGGGIFNRARLTVGSCTVNGNIAVEGGGIYNHRRVVIEGPVPTDILLTLSNSTLSGNRAFTGGGLVNGDYTQMINCTLFGNRADEGGGIRYLGETRLHVGNTLIAGSGAGLNCVGDDAAAVISLGGNLDSDGTCGLTAPSDQSGTPGAPLDPKLGPLQNNGGPTETHALAPGSPAIDAGEASLQPAATDQRGFPRVVDGNGDGVAVIDTGAYELGFYGLRDFGGPLADGLLTYSTVQEQETSLPAGTETFNLTIHYSANIAPRTFTARINGRDISHLFNPGNPEGYETVRIPLRKGPNRLILKVKGRQNGRPATDVDHLGFRVGEPPFGRR